MHDLCLGRRRLHHRAFLQVIRHNGGSRGHLAGFEVLLWCHQHEELPLLPLACLCCSVTTAATLISRGLAHDHESRASVVGERTVPGFIAGRSPSD